MFWQFVLVVYEGFEQALFPVHALCVVSTGLLHVPPDVQLLWVVYCESEQVPPDVQVLCEVYCESEQLLLPRQTLRGVLPALLHVPLMPSHDLSVPSSNWSQVAL